VHVVISDIQMPSCNGIELLKYIKDKNPTLPIVMMMTGYAEMSSEAALEKGADAMFSKPFDRKELVNAVMKLVVSYGEEINHFAGSVHTDLKIKMSFNHKKKFVESRVINLSSKGLFVSLEESFPEVCDEINFDMQFKDEEWLNAVTGLVKWVSFKSKSRVPSGVGIEFSGMTYKKKKKIDDIIKQAQERANPATK
jgi:CheY-like chemotaxis protein